MPLSNCQIGIIPSVSGRSTLSVLPLTPIQYPGFYQLEFFGRTANASSIKSFEIIMGGQAGGVNGKRLLQYGPVSGEGAFSVFISIFAYSGGQQYGVATQLDLQGSNPGITENFAFDVSEIANNYVTFIAQSQQDGDVLLGAVISYTEQLTQEEPTI